MTVNATKKNTTHSPECVVLGLRKAKSRARE